MHCALFDDLGPLRILDLPEGEAGRLCLILNFTLRISPFELFLLKLLNHRYILALPASLAQLDRASGFEPEGWGFESLRVHDKKFEVRSVKFEKNANFNTFSFKLFLFSHFTLHTSVFLATLFNTPLESPETHQNCGTFYSQKHLT